jgi:hypothetical protein
MKELYEKQQFQKQVTENLTTLGKAMGYDFAEKALGGFKSFNQEQRKQILEEIAEKMKGL